MQLANKTNAMLGFCCYCCYLFDEANLNVCLHKVDTTLKQTNQETNLFELPKAECRLTHQMP